MLRVFLVLICLIFNFSLISFGSTISDAIDLYKGKDYQSCIEKCNQVVKSDPTSVLGYYYLGISYAKRGNSEMALKNYNKVIALNSDKTLTSLAKSGKSKIAIKDKDKEKDNQKKITAVETMLEDVDEDTKSVSVSKDVQPQQKTEVKPQVSEKKPVQAPKQQNVNSNNSQPTNDEIVNAIRVLQRAGLLPNGLCPQPQAGSNQNYQANYTPEMDARTQEMNAMLMMMNSGNNGYNNNNNMMNMLPYLQNGGKMSPQMLQMMMMRQMTPDFSSGNNNGY